MLKTSREVDHFSVPLLLPLLELLFLLLRTLNVITEVKDPAAKQGHGHTPHHSHAQNIPPARR